MNNYQPTQVKEQPKMSQALASKGMMELATTLALTPEQISSARSAALALSSNENLANCDPYSLIKFCYETARYNFKGEGCIYPVPYKGRVQAQISYIGFRELAMRSERYSKIDASIVRKADKVYRDKLTGEIKVEFSEDLDAVNGEIIGYYAYALDKKGRLTASRYMSKAEVDEHKKKYSKAPAFSPWQSEFDKMALKTVIKQLCKSLPTSLIDMARKQDQLVYGGNGEKDTYADNPMNDKNARTALKAPQIAVDEETGEVSANTQPTEENALEGTIEEL